ncbi:helix-hairpin-helix domain-containing protein [Halorubrum sp. 48-1-W]|uniref:helix-hairpin-helix domain-containing protein n=1 Tax=Halorubrum sp. 48-1-W TaxID=2249761 RepID=UPI0013009880|nr:helix-hairpin-helix domain-containing protein [Halorubrum sp. 48-1-W]
MSSLEAIYGVGDVRAGRLREHGLETVEAVANAPVDELADLLDGVGRSRARKIRYSARRIAAEEGGETGRTAGPGDADEATGGYVTSRPVAAADTVVVVPGHAFLTRPGRTDYPDRWGRALVSVPTPRRVGPDAEMSDLADAVVLCPPERTAAVAPTLYAVLVERTADGEAVTPPTDAESVLEAVVRPGTVMSGETLRDAAEDRRVSGDELSAVLRNGTVLRPGGSFDLADPERSASIGSAGGYLSGDRVLPAGWVFDAGERVRGTDPPRCASFLAQGVATVPGRRVADRLPDADGGPRAVLPLLRTAGVLLPPGSVRER